MQHYKLTPLVILSVCRQGQRPCEDLVQIEGYKSLVSQYGWISWMSGQVGVLRAGICSLSSLSTVNTDANWLFKIFALPKLSVTT